MIANLPRKERKPSPDGGDRRPDPRILSSIKPAKEDPMRHRPSWKLAAAALTIAAIGFTIGAATPDAAPAAHAMPTRLILIEHELAAPTLDLGKHGFSPLDRQTITSNLLDLHGKLVGRLDADCAITAVGKRAGAVCSYAITLRNGQLVGTRFDDFTARHDGPQPITGGSGAYLGARGQIRPLKKTKRGLEFAIELKP
jgi:hypothetical protein